MKMYDRETQMLSIERRFGALLKDDQQGKQSWPVFLIILYELHNIWQFWNDFFHNADIKE